VPQFIAGIYSDRALAERVVRALKQSGVPTECLSLALREEAEEDLSHRDQLAEETPFVGLAVHSAWERVGWQGGARPAYRDRIPPNIEFALIVAGPLAIALGGAQIGATAGGVVGALTNFGFPHDTARDFYERITAERQALVVAQSDDPAIVEKARSVMQSFRPALLAEASRPW